MGFFPSAEVTGAKFHFRPRLLQRVSRHEEVVVSALISEQSHISQLRGPMFLLFELCLFPPTQASCNHLCATTWFLLPQNTSLITPSCSLHTPLPKAQLLTPHRTPNIYTPNPKELALCSQGHNKSHPMAQHTDTSEMGFSALQRPRNG